MKRKISLFLLLLVSVFTLCFTNVKVSAATGSYVKVTENLSDWSGTYLIVYETNKVAFNGGLSTLDAVSNTISVTITNGEIESNDTTDAAVFIISKYSSGYSIKSASGKYINRTTNSNGMESSNSASANTISFSNGVVTIKGSAGPSLQFNKTSGQTRFRYFKSSQQAIALYKYVENTGHEHSYDEMQEPTNDTLVSAATCYNSAVYYKVCSCGSLSKDTYEYGEALGHSYEDGVCIRCGLIDESLDTNQRVKILFEEYWNEGEYTKDSVLNVNTESMDEVKTYFHASASIRYRKTVYTNGAISMVTSTDGVEFNLSNISKYEDKDGMVYHSGLNNPYYVNWTSVEDKFVSLYDFANTSYVGWSYENGIYTHNLALTTYNDGVIEEDSLTYDAREFIAPMWLAPNKDNYNYVTFTKITVEVVDGALVMKLYVDAANSGALLEGSDNVFSQVTINKGAEDISTLVKFDFGDNGATGHSDGSEAGTSKSYNVNGYTLSLTDMSKVYASAKDELGNSALKLGTSSVAGKLTFTVDSSVNSVVIYIAGYKSNTAKVKINGTTYTINTYSNNGAYTAIKIDTTSTKTISLETVSGGYRCMIDAIEFKAQ